MDNNTVVKSINYRQCEILRDIMNLHNGGNAFDCDITYSKGKFYGMFKDGSGGFFTIPSPVHKFDVCPQTEDTVKIEADGKLPLDDNSIDTIVIDLPFLCSKGPSLTDIKKGSNIIIRRFNNYGSFDELYQSYRHWLSEAHRVLKDGGKCIFKCQNVISSGKYYCTEEVSWMLAHELGFYTLDRFILLAKNRLISGKHKNQKHARNFSSCFWIFEKNRKNKQINYKKLLEKNGE